MEIKGPGSSLPPQLTPVAQSPTTGQETLARLNWQNGQLLQALVVQQDARHLLLDILGQHVLARNRPEYQFTTGQKLTLQVLQLRPEPLFKLLAPQIRPSGGVQAELSQALRLVLPRQTPLPPLLANLETVARRPEQHPPLPAPVRKAAWDIHQLLPEPRQVSQADSLKQALQRTGPFAEYVLAVAARQTQAGQTGQASQPEPSLHLSLLRLANLLRQQIALQARSPGPATEQTTSQARATTAPPLPLATGQTGLTSPAGGAPPSAARPEPAPAAHQQLRAEVAQSQPRAMASLQSLTTQDSALQELLRQVDGSLARLNAQQLHSAQAGEQTHRPLWAMELPVRSDQGVDLFDLRIRQEQEQAGDDPEYQCPWSVILAFDLEGLGPVKVNITLLGQMVSARFQMEQDHTRNLFSGALEQLRSRLNSVGLEVGRLECAADQPDNSPPGGGHRILDERA